MGKARCDYVPVFIPQTIYEQKVNQDLPLAYEGKSSPEILPLRGQILNNSLVFFYSCDTPSLSFSLFSINLFPFCLLSETHILHNPSLENHIEEKILDWIGLDWIVLKI